MNINNAILEEAKKIARQGEEKDFAEAQEILMSYLKDHPQDTQAWLLLITIECNPIFDDYDRIVHYANHILFYDFSNAYALLFLSYADYSLRGNLDDSLYDKLCMAHNDDLAVMSMIEVAKARYFQYRDPVKSEEALKKSIEYCSTHVKNFYMLGNLYIQQGKTVEGNFLLEHALKNVKRMVDGEGSYHCDSASMEEFLAEFFSGTTMVKGNFMLG